MKTIHYEIKAFMIASQHEDSRKDHIPNILKTSKAIPRSRSYTSSPTDIIRARRSQRPEDTADKTSRASLQRLLESKTWKTVIIVVNYSLSTLIVTLTNKEAIRQKTESRLSVKWNTAEELTSCLFTCPRRIVKRQKPSTIQAR